MGKPMNIQAIIENPPRISEVKITDCSLCYVLDDGREITVPIDYYPSLALATKAERENYEIFPVSVYWPALDADIGVEGLLLGAKEHPAYAEKAVARAQKRGLLPKNTRHKAA
jgi:hypothetical protein